MNVPGVTIHFGEGEYAFCITDGARPGEVNPNELPPIKRAVAIARLRAAADVLEAATP